VVVMTVRSLALVSGMIMAVLSLAGTARAQAHGEGHGESEYPVSYVERPLTLPRLTLAPFGEIDITRIGVDTTSGGVTIKGEAVVAGMQIGAAFGITKDLEVGAVVLPIQFNNGAGYGGLFVGEEGTLAQPSVFATFRFLHQPIFDLGARLRVQFVVPRNDIGLGAGAIIEPSIPFLLHIGKIGRFDAEVGVPITVLSTTVGIGPTTTTHVAAGIDVPLRLAFDIIEPLHVGVSTGVVVEDFGDAGVTTRIPLGIFMGYAVGEKRPIVDIDPFFSFFDFLTPGGGPFGDKVNPGIFVAGISVRGYVYF
jgi:hypothetical protein